MPTLIVLRHAKAVAGLGTPDIERALNERGRRDAAAAGDWLRANDLVPDRVVCSTAARTRETLDLLATGAGVSFEPGIYDNDPDGLLALLNRVQGDVRRLLLVGHQRHLLKHRAPPATGLLGHLRRWLRDFRR